MYVPLAQGANLLIQEQLDRTVGRIKPSSILPLPQSVLLNLEENLVWLCALSSFHGSNGCLLTGLFL
jgi:hypothetical protein